jgi:hypothetical protein
MDLGEIWLGAMDWIHLAQDRDQQWALVNVVMNLGSLEMLGNSWVAERLVGSQVAFGSMELIS